MNEITCTLCEEPELSDMERLARMLSSEDADRYEELLKFWLSWFQGDIPGQKVTVVATTGTGQMVGVVRFWCSPYCDQKWLVEGLEVHPDRRRYGIGEQLLITGIDHLKGKGVPSIWSHIHRNNVASVRLHEKVGFCLVSQGYINSWGDSRDNGGEYFLALGEAKRPLCHQPD